MSYLTNAAATPGILTLVSPTQPNPEGRTKKIEVILKVFLSGTRLNRFEAEAHHDHCLHSTVASLQACGVLIDREWERVPCLRGRTWTRCKRYWLDRTTANLEAARKLLNTLRKAS